MTEVTINKTIPSEWDLLDTIRREVGDVTAKLHPDVQHACVMTASELVENAIKYGEQVNSLPQATFSFSLIGNQVTISVSNGLRSRSSYEQLEAHIERIEKSENKMMLYLERLEILSQMPSDSAARLGLYRIGMEGAFNLSCHYVNEVLVVTATRKLEESNEN